MKARACGKVSMRDARGKRLCTRPRGHLGTCRHIAARAVSEATQEHRAELRSERRVVRGPQLAIPAVVEPAKPSKAQALAMRTAARSSLVEGGTYRQQFTRCGKASCRRCPHGPYWFVEWQERGRFGARAKTKTMYVGKRLPTAEIASFVIQTGSPEAAAAAAEELASAAEERGE